VYPKCPAGNSEGHWLSALHRFASVFSKPSILTLELTFFLLSLFFFPFEKKRKKQNKKKETRKKKKDKRK
jgi:hypothetical protein